MPQHSKAEVGWMVTFCLELPTCPKGLSSVLYPRADEEETGMSLDRISAHTVALVLNQWTMRTPTATPHPPDALHFSLALFSGHFPTDEGKQQIMTIKLW